MTSEELTAAITPHENHPLVHTCRVLFGLVSHWKGLADNLRKRDVDAAGLQQQNDELRVTVWRLETELEALRSKAVEPDLPKTADELIAFLKGIEATVFLDGKQPRLRITPGIIDPVLMGKLRPLIVLHRDAVLNALDQTTEQTCAECGSTLDLGIVTADEVFDGCRRPCCPFWRAGHPASSLGLEKQRSYEFWKRGKDAEREAENAIPD